MLHRYVKPQILLFWLFKSCLTWMLLIAGGYHQRVLRMIQSLHWTRLRTRTMRWRLPEQGPQLWRLTCYIALYCIVL
jgi:hypothetical protein